MKNLLFIGLCLAALIACQNGLSQKESIKTTTSGYRYSISRDVAGELIQPGQFALIHSTVRHGDSVLTDTRDNPGRPSMVKIDPEGTKRGASAPVQDLLKLMSEGDSARLYYPVDSFPTKPPRLAEYKEIAYDLVILDVFNTEEEAKAYMDAENEKAQAPIRAIQALEQGISEKVNAFYASFKKGEKDALWKTTPSGLKYIIEESTGGTKPKPGDLIKPHYYGVMAADGSMFDNSYKRGSTLDFVLGNGEMIPAWEEGFQLFGVGEKGYIYVPSALGYGAQGHPAGIAPNSDLIFYVDLTGIGE